MSKPIFKIENLSVEKKKKKILFIKSFEIHRGACYVISGKVGSGKSTFINTLAKIEDNFNGEIFYEGENIKLINKKTFYKTDHGEIYKYKNNRETSKLFGPIRPS